MKRFFVALVVFSSLHSFAHGMDSSESMDVEESQSSSSSDEKQQPSLLLVLPNEVQQRILVYLATPTFRNSDWMTRESYNPEKLVYAIENRLKEVDSSMESALWPSASSCKQLLKNARSALKNEENREWIRSEYSFEKIVQALRDALNYRRTSLGKIIAPHELVERHSVLNAAVSHVSKFTAEIVQIVLLASDKPQELVFYAKETNGITVLHCAAKYCRSKEAIVMLLEAAGDRAKELYTKRSNATGARRYAAGLAQLNFNKEFFAAVEQVFYDHQPDDAGSTDEESIDFGDLMCSGGWCTII